MAAATLSNLTIAAAPAAARTDAALFRRPSRLPVAAGKRCRRAALVVVRSAPTPPEISEKVSESIKEAEEACGGAAATTAECAAAWDEVEELSAAASHARDKIKEASDPLENYCKDNPETDECRTYDS